MTLKAEDIQGLKQSPIFAPVCLQPKITSSHALGLGYLDRNFNSSSSSSSSSSSNNNNKSEFLTSLKYMFYELNGGKLTFFFISLVGLQRMQNNVQDDVMCDAK